MTRILVTLLLLLASLSAQAGPSEDTVFSLQTAQPIERVYPAVYQALEDAGFFVVFEANIGASLSRFAERWGKDYNRNGLSAIRSMVFCNGWYANRVGNADPRMLALCPLRMTLIEKDGRTTALFARPTAVARSGPAHEVLKAVEKEVIDAIRKGMAQKAPGS